jgi:hypothetical protein
VQGGRVGFAVLGWVVLSLWGGACTAQTSDAAVPGHTTEIGRPMEADRIALSGTVRDDRGVGVAGVAVKVFVDGLVEGTSLSEADGSYSVGFVPGAVQHDDLPRHGSIAGSPLTDRTIIVWWVPTSSEQIPALLVLHESARVKSLGAWSPCIPRRTVRPRMTYDVVLHRQAERRKILAEADCLKQQG